MGTLKPCPCCNGEVYITLQGSEYSYYWMITGGAKESDCHCRLYMESNLFNFKTGLEAEQEYDRLVEKWNTRF